MPKPKKQSLNSFLGGPSALKTGAWADEDEDEHEPVGGPSTWRAGSDAPPANFGRGGDRAQRENKPQGVLPESGPYSLYVGNLPYDADEEVIKNALNEPSIQNVRIVPDKEKDRPCKGFCYVETGNDRATAQSLLDKGKNGEYTLAGRTLRVDVEEKKSGGFGSGMGRSDFSRDGFSSNSADGPRSGGPVSFSRDGMGQAQARPDGNERGERGERGERPPRAELSRDGFSSTDTPQRSGGFSREGMGQTQPTVPVASGDDSTAQGDGPKRAPRAELSRDGFSSNTADAPKSDAPRTSQGFSREGMGQRQADNSTSSAPQSDAPKRPARSDNFSSPSNPQRSQGFSREGMGQAQRPTDHGNPPGFGTSTAGPGGIPAVEESGNERRFPAGRGGVAANASGSGSGSGSGGGFGGFGNGSPSREAFGRGGPARGRGRGEDDGGRGRGRGGPSTGRGAPGSPNAGRADAWSTSRPTTQEREAPKEKEVVKAEKTKSADGFEAASRTKRANTSADQQAAQKQAMKAKETQAANANPWDALGGKKKKKKQ